MTNTNIKKFEAIIWEKAEHWTFQTTILAVSEEDAYVKLAKEFPKRSYSVRSVQRVFYKP